MNDKSPTNFPYRSEEQKIEVLQSLDVGNPESLKILADALGDDSRRIRKESIHTFSSWPDSRGAVIELVAVVENSTDPTPRNAALEALVAIGRECLEILCTKTAEKSPVRKLFIDTMGAVGNPAATAVLNECLENDVDENVRMAAAEALGKIGGSPAKRALEKNLGKDGLLVTVARLNSLWKIGKPLRAESILKLLSVTAAARPAVVRAMGLAAGDLRVISPLTAALSDPVPGVRRAALEAFSVAHKIFDEPGRASLIRSVSGIKRKTVILLAGELQNRRPDIRRAAAVVLSWRRDKSLIKHLLPAVSDEETGDSALEALCYMSPEVIPELGKLMRNSNPKTRKSLYEFAAWLPGVKKSNFEDLHEPALQDIKSQDEELAVSALRVVAKMGDKKSISAISLLVTDSNSSLFIRREAARAIGVLGSRHRSAVIRSVDMDNIDPDLSLMITARMNVEPQSSKQMKKENPELLSKKDPGTGLYAERESEEDLSFKTHKSATSKEFRFLRELIVEHCGFLGGDDYIERLGRKLNPRLTELRMQRFSDYCRYLRSEKDRRSELSRIIDLVVNNETYFFRESHQLKALSTEIFPEIRKSGKPNDRLAVWSAGCSSGEEPLTIAIMVRESGIFSDWEVRIFGSDISQKAIMKARRGLYGPSSFRLTDKTREAYLKRVYFEKKKHVYEIKPDIKNMVSYHRANLLDPSDLAPLMNLDVIICRNVFIYFPEEVRSRVARTFYNKLKPGGYLLLGHSENLLNTSTDFQCVRLVNDLVYRKSKNAGELKR